MSWGGIRGVMSIVLALIVVADAEAGNARFRDLCVYFASFTVMLSMLINNTTVEWVWKKVGLILTTPAHARWLHICEQDHFHQNVEEYHKCSREYVTRFANWDDVQILSGLHRKAEKNVDSYMDLVVMMADKKKQKVDTYVNSRQNEIEREHANCIEKHSTTIAVSLQEIIEEVRLKYYNLVVKLALEKKEESKMDAYVFTIIRHIVVIRKSELDEPFDFHDSLKDELGDVGLKYYHQLYSVIKMPLIGKLLRNHIVDTIKYGYDISYNLKKIFQEIIKKSKENEECVFKQGDNPRFNQA